jgi:hypothetical protein
MKARSAPPCLVDALPVVIRSPIFIVGAMRSGTTLLAEMLDRSEHIAYCRFELKDVWSQVGGIPMASPKTRDLTCPECTASDMRVGQRAALAATFLERMALCHGKVHGATLLNKNPHLSNKLPLVRALFPDSRFIWTFRDLPQVVASIMRLFSDVCKRQQTWHWWPYPCEMTRHRCWRAFYSVDCRPDIPRQRIFPGGDVRFIAEYWLESNRAIVDFFNELPEPARIEVKQQALLSDPVKELARIAARLGIPAIDCRQLRDNIDRTRNDQWSGLLDEDQIKILGEFVRSHAQEVEAILPGEDAVSRYLGWCASGK